MLELIASQAFYKKNSVSHQDRVKVVQPNYVQSALSVFEIPVTASVRLSEEFIVDKRNKAIGLRQGF